MTLWPRPLAVAAAILTLTTLWTSCTRKNAAPAPVMPAASQAQPDAAAPRALIERIRDGRAPVYPLDFSAYANPDWASLPIGVFDSGVGGLTVLDAILRLDEHDNRTHAPGADGIPDFANERFVYFGDQANMPYGRYASEGKEDFLRELIVQDAAFLLGNRYWPAPDAALPRTDKPHVKAVVVACNTATAYGINDLRAAFETWGIPMILVGVVEAGAQGAVATLASQGEDPGAIAVMATVGTCKSNAYPRAIERYASAAGVKAPPVVQHGSVGLAGAIEGDRSFVGAEGSATAAYQGPAVDPSLSAQYGFDQSGIIDGERLNSVENYVRYDVTTLVESYRKSGGQKPIGSVVLGCTHFPFVRDEITAAFERLRTFQDENGAQPYSELVGARIDVVDPATLTAKQLYEALSAKKRLRDANAPEAKGRDFFFISRPNTALPEVKLSPGGALDTGYKYGRPTGEYDQETVKRVPLRPEDLTPELRQLVQRSMPAVWNRMTAVPATKPVSRQAVKAVDARP